MNLAMHGEESLRLSGGFQSSHLTFVLPGMPVSGLCPIIGVAVRVMDDGRHDLSFGSAVALNLSVIIHRGDWPCSCNILRKKRLAACLPLRLCIRISMTWSSGSTARHR